MRVLAALRDEAGTRGLMGKARILAVDDPRYFRELIEGRLDDEGDQVQTCAAAGEALGGSPEARNFHGVMLAPGERLSPDDRQENLSLIDEARLFLLPIEPQKDPSSLLRSLFSRIVP